MGFQFGAGATLNGWGPGTDFGVAFSAPVTVTNYGAGNQLVRDMSIAVSAYSTTDTTFQATLTNSTLGAAYLTDLDNGTVVTIDGTGTAHIVATGLTFSGTANIEVNVPSAPILGVRKYQLPITRTYQPPATQTFNNYQAGSLAADLSAMLDGVVPAGGHTSTNCLVFPGIAAARPYAPPGNTRNSALWCAGVIDLTGATREQMTVIDGTGTLVGYEPYGFLISPHHLIGNAHTIAGGLLTGVGGNAGGGLVGWVDANGVGYAGVVINSKKVAGLYNPATDGVVLYVNDFCPGHATLGTSAQVIAAYNAAHSTSVAATQPLSAAFPSGQQPKLKPFAFFPANVWEPTGTSALPLYNSPAGKMQVPVFAFSSGVVMVEELVGGGPIPGASGGRFDWSDGLGLVAYDTQAVGLGEPTGGAITDSALRYAMSRPVVLPSGGVLSGDGLLTAIPAGSKLASFNSGIDFSASGITTHVTTSGSTTTVGYPIFLYSKFTIEGGPFFAAYTGAGGPIALAMQATAQAFNALPGAISDPLASSYAPATVSLAGYTAF